MNFSPDPWELLGLRRGASGEREVKRAYARLLKLHRPDQDPEGFQRVSGAYQQALRDLQEDAEFSPETPATSLNLPPGPETTLDPANGPGAPGASPEPQEESAASETAPSDAGPRPRRLEDFPDLPEKFLSGCERLRERMQRVAQPVEVPEFNMLRNMVREGPARLAAPWVVVLEALFQTERGLRLLPQINPADVLLLMRHGEGGCAARILMTWRDDISLLNRLTQLANLMLEQKVGNDPGMLRAMHFTAQMAAFHLPHVAGRLADELYRQTGPGVREQIVREIELRSAAGKAFATFSLPQRRIWEQQLFENGEGEADWSRPEAIAALQSVMASCGQDWEGWPLVTRVVPEDLLDRTLSQVRQAQATARPAPKRSWLPSGRWAFAILWLTAHILSAVFKSDPVPSAPNGGIPPVPSSFRSSSGSKTARQTELDRMQEALDKSRGSHLKPLPSPLGTSTPTIELGPENASDPLAPPPETTPQIPSVNSWSLKFNPTTSSSPSDSASRSGGSLNLRDSLGK